MTTVNSNFEDAPREEHRADSAKLEDFRHLENPHVLGGMGHLALVPRKEFDETHSINLIGNYLELVTAAPATESPAGDAITDRIEQADRSKEIFRLFRNEETYEVTVESDLTLDDWKEITPEKDWNLMLGWADNLREGLDGKSVVFINPTMEGGGVAMMRPPLVHMLRLLGIDARWYVMEGPKNGEPNVFEVTKKMHNIIQRRLPDDERLTSAEKALHQKWATDNAAVLMQQESIINAGVVNIDDPQPAPLLPYLKLVNPSVKIAWRNHIDNSGPLMEDPSTPQGEVWQYLMDECGLAGADAYIFHPDIHNLFVPKGIYEKTFLAPAVIEPHDDMNRGLSGKEIDQGLADINNQITQSNQKALKEGRLDDVQELLDPDRDRIVLIARFDESKGMDKAMAFGALVRKKVLEKRQAAGITGKKPVQIILIGNGSGDDPSGDKMRDEMLSLRKNEHADIKQDIIVQRLLHNYVAINATMYNQNEDAVLIGMQMSDAEGCETRISDWIDHGIPMVVANRGGMPLQVVKGKSGIVLDSDRPDFDHERGAEYASDLIVNTTKYKAMRGSTLAASESHNRREYTTTANVTRLMRVYYSALIGAPADKEYQIKELAKATV